MREKILANGRILATIALVVLYGVLVPLTSSTYQMSVMNLAMFYFVSALGLTVLQGMGGMMSMATFSIMGVSAFTTAQLSRNFGVHSLLSVIIAVMFTTVFSFALGAVLLRLSGSFFVFATIGFSQIANNIFLNYKPLTGGPDGTSAIPKLNLGPLSPKNLYHWFFLMLFVSIVCGLLVENIRRTHLGRALASVRDNEIAAKSLGINVYFTKLMAFTIAGALAGLAGALIAHHNSFISFSLFLPAKNMMFVMMVMLGGVNSTLGAFVGALLVTSLPEWLRPLKEYLMLIYGFGVILLMVFMPTGMSGVVNSFIERARLRIAKAKEVDSNG